MIVYEPAAIFQQLSNASFFLAAVFGDILLIRLFLTSAYVFLLVSAALGYPRWPNVGSTGGIAVDGVVWATLSGSLHALALLRLLLDERTVRFCSADEEQLWRFFYRRSGMGRLEMKEVLKRGRWLHIPAGTTILDPIAAYSRLCLLVEGTAVFVASKSTGGDEECPSSPIRPTLLFSGSFFDMRLLNVFGIYIGFEAGGDEKQFHAVARTDCLLYTWSIEELNELATQCSPAVSTFWRNVLACQLGITYEWRETPRLPPHSATGEREDESIFQGTLHFGAAIPHEIISFDNEIHG